MRSRLRKRGAAATAEVVNVAGTRQLYDSTRTCTIRYVRANGEETFARLVSPRSRGLAEGTRVPILYLPDADFLWLYKKNLAGAFPENPFSINVQPETWYYTKPAK